MTNKIDLGGRNAVVTGGAQGIGRAIVERFLDSGAAVAIWDRDIELAKKTAAELKSRGRVTPVAVDVTNYSDVERARDETVKAFGRIDILVNNAGIAGPNVKTWDYPLDAWREVMSVNLDGPFHCCRALAPLMIAQNYGRIVNIASIAGKEGNPNAPAYSASKAGVIALTKSLGKELAAHDISVNCITPAAAKTAIFDQMTQEHIDFMLSKIPRGRFVTVEEIAGARGVLRLGRLLVHDRRGVRHFRWPGNLLNDPSHAAPPAADRHRPDVRRGGAVRLPRHHGEISQHATCDPLQVVWARYFGAFLLALIVLQPAHPAGADADGAAACCNSAARRCCSARPRSISSRCAICSSTRRWRSCFRRRSWSRSLAGPMLGEWVGWRRWTAIGVGFFGVLLVARPGFGGMHPAALLSLGSAVCYAFYAIITRMLSRTDSNETTLFYSNLVGAS